MIRKVKLKKIPTKIILAIRRLFWETLYFRPPRSLVPVACDGHKVRIAIFSEHGLPCDGFNEAGPITLDSTDSNLPKKRKIRGVHEHLPTDLCEL